VEASWAQNDLALQPSRILGTEGGNSDSEYLGECEAKIIKAAWEQSEREDHTSGALIGEQGGK